VWNRLGTRVLPKRRAGDDLRVGVELSVTLNAGMAQNVELDIRQILEDLGLQNSIRIEPTE
jgi:hypothetical protein